MEMKIDLPSVEEIDQTEEKSFLDAVEGLVLKKFRENENENSIIVSVDDIGNVAAVEEVDEKLIKNFFEQKGIRVVFPYIDGENGDKYFQFTMPPEKAV